MADGKAKEEKKGKEEKKEKKDKKNKGLLSWANPAGKDVHFFCKGCGTHVWKRPGGEAAPVYIVSSQLFALDDKWRIPESWGQPLNLWYSVRVVDVPGDAALKYNNAPTAFGGDGTLCDK